MKLNGSMYNKIKKPMKNKNPAYVLLTLAIVAALSFKINAQSIERQSISIYGSSTTLDGITIQQTVGQPYSTISYSDGQIMVNPGFQQSLLLSSVLQDDLLGSSLQLNIYPNPVISSLSVEIPQDLDASTVQITDVTGKVYLDEQVVGLERYSINCDKWPNGLYLITLMGNSQSVYSAKFLINK